MDELYKRFNEVLKENTTLKHKIIDLRSTLSSKEQELSMIKESINHDLYLKKIEILEQENKDLKNSIEKNQDYSKSIEMKEIHKEIDESKQKSKIEINMITQMNEEKLKDPKDELKEYLRNIREYVTGLTGYKIEFRDGEIILHSIYAFDNEDVLIFRYKSGSMELINNEFARSWTSEIQNYLIAGKSIPAFLAIITLELFNKKTFG